MNEKPLVISRRVKELVHAKLNDISIKTTTNPKITGNNNRIETDSDPYKPIKYILSEAIMRIQKKRRKGKAKIKDTSRTCKLLIIILYLPNLLSAKNPDKG